VDLTEWINGFDGAVTVSSLDGTIIFMNDKACETFKEDGGRDLVGKNVLDCHPEPARSKLVEILSTRRKNVYTIEKRGVRKIIYQAPWYQGGRLAGVLELSLEIPHDMPHFVREG